MSAVESGSSLTEGGGRAAARIRIWMEFQFALLSAAGGLVLASREGTEGIAVLALFFALFGFVFVDWLRLFQLPPLGAYVAMGGAAVYCVYDFWGMQQRGQSQMVSVAILLVLVQGVLMMQRKSRRILEQLAVFCLLELVVAAIFNDAINFGLMMVPIAIVGASALSLLGLVTLSDPISIRLDPDRTVVPETRWGRLLQFLAGQSDEQLQPHPLVASSSPESVVSNYRAAGSWSRFATLTLTPAIFLIAAAFFYVLPRKVDAGRSAIGGPALVGFADEVHLEQLGQVMQNPKTALKIALADSSTRQPYRVTGSVYLRGKTLEHYQVDYSTPRPIAKWVSADKQPVAHLTSLPRWYIQSYGSPTENPDPVLVTIQCETMSKPALFSIAPYFSVDRGSGIVHTIGRWTLRRESTSPPFPRINYGFETLAFSEGVQTKWIPARRLSSIYRSRPTLSDSEYREELLWTNPSSVPTARRLAQQVSESVSESERSRLTLALAMEQYLATDPRFQYSLNLDADPIPNVDPIEQFLSVDRRGHCQYFASALAMMLRSVGIPCRLVVGYRTDEYNPVGNYHIARQQHAHAWVEALIRSEDLPGLRTDRSMTLNVENYWLRLDPTPGIDESQTPSAARVGGLVKLANNVWEDYVVDMNGKRQSEDLVEVAGLENVQNSYRGAFDRLKQIVQALQAGQFRGDRIGADTRLPVLPALAVLAIAVACTGLIRLVATLFQGRQKTSDGIRVPDRPAAAFYDSALRQLERIGIHRQIDETPSELCHRSAKQFPPIAELTRAFESLRYGHGNHRGAEDLEKELVELTELVERRLTQDASNTTG